MSIFFIIVEYLLFICEKTSISKFSFILLGIILNLYILTEKVETESFFSVCSTNSKVFDSEYFSLNDIFTFNEISWLSMK